ncbi:hypothetical protein [Dyadobacter sp. CY347]|uniref:hypothetical protein n=1 Tax=Dyadobacter sp. CY347 TaxID=2909336 RepID=UPI001F435244|nr:hypothetical protein [Dyadobacter sp. CY347]MCF2488013.1 hypothetical protein [Dyadobacter sp. CY347]
MKNQLCCFVFYFMILGCERKHSPSPTPGANIRLKNVTVEGAKSVLIDHDAKTIQVLLPESYQSDLITLKMDLAEGFVVTLDDPFISMYFRGFEPRPLIVNNTFTNAIILYKVYVDLEGALQARLKEDIYVTENGTAIADIDFTHGVGTIPERPDDAEKIEATLRDLSTGAAVVKNTGPYFFYFEDGYKLLPSENVELSITYYQEQFVFPQKLKLGRMQVGAQFDGISNWWHTIPKSQQITIAGGCFLPGKSYRVKLENAPENKALWVNAKYEGPDRLQVNIPSNVGNGNYYVSVYEDKDVISSTIYMISDRNNENGFQRIWTNKPVDNEFDPGFFEPIKARAGEEIFISPFPIFTGTFDGPKVTVDKFPSLKIKGSQGSFDVFPKVKEDRTYGDGALVLFFGSYTLPVGVKPGKYQMQLNFKESGVSGPFCKELEVN